MRDDINHYLMSGSIFLHENSTKPEFTLYSFGQYPAMTENGTTSIKGEVYLVPEENMQKLDELEEHPNFYTRQLIKLQDNEEVETYIIRSELIGNYAIEKITSGIWKEFKPINTNLDSFSLRVHT